MKSLVLFSMIDTARFRIPGNMPVELLEEWACTRKLKKDGNVWYSYSNKFEGPFGSAIQIRYYPQDVKMNPNSLILVETSLPKLFFGNNVEVMKNTNEVVAAVKLLESFISEPLARKVDLSKAELDRIDLCYSHYVGDHVDDYIKYLFKLEHPKRKTKPYYPTEGVQFYAKSVTLIFYDKYEESKNENALGILREELSLVTKKSVRVAFGNSSGPVFITDFTADVVEQILQKENEKLDLNDVVIADKTLSLKVLVDKYGTEQGMRLYGYICASSITDNKGLKNLGISKQTISRNKASIRESGLAYQLIDSDVKLPSLTINLKSSVE